MSSAAQQPAYRARIGYQGVLLGLFSTLATLLLMVGHLSTRGAIAARQRDDLQASLSQVIPPGLHDNDLLADTRQIRDETGSAHLVYRATHEGQVTGLAYRVTAFGYGGAIQIIMAVKPDGELLGVRVLSHSETPGLGDHIDAAKDDWILQFTGLGLGKPPEQQWKVKKDGGYFDQFTGATITPRAVVKAIKQGLMLFRTNRQALLGPDQATPTQRG